MLTLNSYVVSADPKISVVPEFLSRDECRHIIELAEGESFQRSLVGRGKYTAATPDLSSELKNHFSENRTSSSVTLNPYHDRVVELIEHRLAGLVKMDVNHLESLVVVKYEPGQFFKQHLDGMFRLATVFIYLNDLPGDAGGETYFTSLRMRVKPRVGTAVVWNNSSYDADMNLVEDTRLLHEGLPPIGCTKYAVNCFFNQCSMRENCVPNTGIMRL